MRERERERERVGRGVRRRKNENGGWRGVQDAAECKSRMEVSYGMIRRKVKGLTRWKAMKDKRWSRTRHVAEETEMSWRKIASENLYLIVAIGSFHKHEKEQKEQEREQQRRVGGS